MVHETKEFRQTHRRNGWSCRPDALQMFGLFMIGFFGLFFFAVHGAALLPSLQPTAYSFFAVSIVVHFIFHMLSSSINPADPNVIRKRNNTPLPRFDRTTHHHVIEDLYCHICEVHVNTSSKHCSNCNKCVIAFDHHCRWLNNCVGSRNYRFFLATLGAGICGLLVLFIVCLFQFIAYFVNRDAIYPGVGDAACLHGTGKANESTVVSDASKNRTTQIDCLRIFFVPVSDTAWLVVTALNAVLAIVGLGLLFHLFFFHIYLMCKGMSTFDFIMAKREEGAAKSGAMNKVTPLDDSEGMHSSADVRPPPGDKAYSVFSLQSNPRANRRHSTGSGSLLSFDRESADTIHFVSKPSHRQPPVALLSYQASHTGKLDADMRKKNRSVESLEDGGQDPRGRSTPTSGRRSVPVQAYRTRMDITIEPLSTSQPASSFHIQAISYSAGGLFPVPIPEPYGLPTSFDPINRTLRTGTPQGAGNSPRRLVPLDEQGHPMRQRPQGTRKKARRASSRPESTTDLSEDRRSPHPADGQPQPRPQPPPERPQDALQQSAGEKEIPPANSEVQEDVTPSDIQQ